MFLNREKIATARDIPQETVSVPEWGGDIVVRGMTLAARNELVRGKGEDAANNAVMLAHCLIGEDGLPIIAPEEAAAFFGSRSPQVIDRLVGVALRLSGLGTGAGKEAEKNSDSEENDTSSSSSQKS